MRFFLNIMLVAGLGLSQISLAGAQGFAGLLTGKKRLPPITLSSGNPK